MNRVVARDELASSRSNLFDCRKDEFCLILFGLNSVPKLTDVSSKPGMTS